MAQELAKKKFPAGIEISSAGINAIPGESLSPNAEKVLRDKRIDYCSHTAVKVTREMIAAADYVFTMTEPQAFLLRRKYPEFQDKIMVLGFWVGLGEVPDPWGGSLEAYRECAEQLEKMLEIAADKLKLAGDELKD